MKDVDRLIRLPIIVLCLWIWIGFKRSVHGDINACKITANFKGRAYLGDQDVDGRIILELIAVEITCLCIFVV
jgi:hypothetical protein